MSRKILIALDGSSRAENALRYIPPFVHPKRTEVTLLHVIPSRNLRNEKKWRQYLKKVVKSQKAREVRWSTRVVHGDPAEKIVQEAEDIAADVVLMSTHGVTGQMKHILGNFAAALSHACPYRMVLVRPPSKPAKGKPLTAVCPLVPGVSLKKLEKELRILFAGTRASVHLLRIGRPFQWSLGGVPPTTPRSTAALTKELSALAKRLERHHVHVHAHITRGDPEDETIRVMRRLEADLVIAQTHKILFLGWRLGSMANEVLSRTNTPVVLLR